MPQWFNAKDFQSTVVIKAETVIPALTRNEYLSTRRNRLHRFQATIQDFKYVWEKNTGKLA